MNRGEAFARVSLSPSRQGSGCAPADKHYDGRERAPSRGFDLRDGVGTGEGEAPAEPESGLSTGCPLATPREPRPPSGTARFSRFLSAMQSDGGSQKNVPVGSTPTLDPT